MTYRQKDCVGVSTRVSPGAHGLLVADGATGDEHAAVRMTTANTAKHFSIRILPSSEYRKLVGTELETLVPHFPNGTQVIAVETPDGTLVGCWALLPVYHAEGVWIHPDYRRGGRVGLRLLEGLRTLCRRLGVRTVATASVSDNVDRLIRHLHALELPGRHFVFKV